MRAQQPLDCSVRLRRGRLAGFTLVELMISVVIGLVIVAALAGLFVNTSGTNREMAKANSLIENGRFAIQVLESDIIHAGFWGSYTPQFDDQTAVGVPTDVPTAVPDPCRVYSMTPTPTWDAAYKQNLLGLPLQAYDTVTVCTGVVTNQKASTDMLVVRHAETCTPGETIGAGTCEADVAGKLYFQSTLCGTDTTRYVLDTTGFTLRPRECTGTTPKRKFVSNIYYIRDYAVTAGDGIPTLVLAEFDLVAGVLAHKPAVPLVEGIEGFRVEFGVDNVSKTGAPVDYGAAVNWLDPMTRTTPTNRGDGIPDTYVRCTGTGCTINQLMNVTAVKIYVLARSRDVTRGYTDSKTYTLGNSTALGPFNDGFKRHVFSTVIRLPNIAGRRETP